MLLDLVRTRANIHVINKNALIRTPCFIFRSTELTDWHNSFFGKRRGVPKKNGVPTHHDTWQTFLNINIGTLPKTTTHSEGID